MKIFPGRNNAEALQFLLMNKREPESKKHQEERYERCAVYFVRKCISCSKRYITKPIVTGMIVKLTCLVKGLL